MKKLLVGCLLAVALTGCAKSSEAVVEDVVMSAEEVTISESQDMEKEPSDVAEETNQTEESIEIVEEKQEEKLFDSGNEIVDQMAAEKVVLEQNETIRLARWVKKNSLYRVEIEYVDTPNGEYDLKRDMLFYVQDDETVTSLEVKYTTKNPTDDSHQVFSACSFGVQIMDVNFDGADDIVIGLGYAGAQGAAVHTAYLGSKEGFTANKSFEDIANFKLDSEKQLIHGNYRSDAGTRVEQSYRYDEATDCFVLTEEIVIDQSMEILFSTVGNFLYDEYADCLDVQNYLLVSRYGETYENDKTDDAMFWTDKRMLTTDLEYFYREVMGESRSFAPSQERPKELGVEFREDGYCYGYNSAGLIGYFAVKNITVDGDFHHVEVGYYDDIDNEIDSISFVMRVTENKYGYTLVGLEAEPIGSLVDSDVQSVDAQIALIESKYDECVSDFLDKEIFADPLLAVTDFNRNGRLELVLTDTMGTGAFSESVFYEVSEDYQSLHQIEMEGDSKYDECGDFHLYDYFDCYKKDDTYYYIVEDYNSSGWDCKGSSFFLYSFDKAVSKIEIGGYVVLGTTDEMNNSTYHVRLYNSEGKLCQSAEEYYNSIEAFLGGFEKMSSSAVKWVSINGEQPAGEKLRKSYNSYHPEVKDSCVNYDYTIIWGKDAEYIIDVE